MNKSLFKAFSLITILALMLMALPMQRVQAVSTSVVISQVYGGGGNSGSTYKNDFIELYNRSTTVIDLTGWSVQYAATTGTSWQKTNLSGFIYPGKYYLVQEAQGAGGTVNLPTPNAIGGISMSATAGKVALVSNNTLIASGTSCPSTNIVDFVGYGTGTNCSETSPTATLSNTNAALRKSNGAQDTDNNNSDFAVGAPNPRNGDIAPSVTSTIPSDGAGNVPFDANITINFSEPVNVSENWFQLVCSVSGVRNVSDTVVSGGPTSFVINPNSDLISGENCTLTIFASQISDQDGNDPPDNMMMNFTAGFSTIDACTLPYTPIYDIQGSGSTAAITGSVTTQGVVVGDYEGASPALRGFYLEDLGGDGDVATSDGIFVFNGDNNNVNLGDVVRVSGSATEFEDQTEIVASGFVNCGTGSVAPVDVTFPVSSPTFLEQYEGMLVTISQTMYVTEHFQLGRFGQVVLSSGGKLKQPTNVVAPGAPALALQAQNDLNKIILDDASQAQNPDPILFGRNGNPLSASNTLRGGDTATGIVGVMTYTWAGNAASGNAYRVRPINALGGSVNFVEANSRPASAPNVGGNIRVVGMNLLNFFNTFADGNTSTLGCFPSGTDADCRGATNATEFDRQWKKTVAAIVAMNPDVVGVNELENDGYGPTSALQFLANQLNAATAPGTYAFIDVDAATGIPNSMGTDAIRVALLYKPAVVTPIGTTSPLNTAAFVNGGDASPRSRPSLAQAFKLNSNNAIFIVDVNHLKSKGSACAVPDAGDGQGNCNQVRVNAATTLMNWFATDPTGTGDPDILMLGDYNSYAKEDPIKVITNAGFTNLIESFLGPDAYSYVFDGQWGYLDHALGSASLVPQVSGVGDYHINSDEPSVLDYLEDFKSASQLVSLYNADQFRISDHDPVVVGLQLNDPPTVNAGGPYSANEGGSVPVSAVGSDPNNDPLMYEWDLDNDGIFETPGQSVPFNVGSKDGPNSYTIKVRATDTGDLFAVASTTVDVANVAPTAIFGAPSSVNEGVNFGVSLSGASDPSDADTTASFTYAFDCGAGYSAFGSSNTATCFAVDNPGVTVKAKIQDKDGGVTEYSAAVVINNVDPAVTASFASSSLSCGVNNATLNVSFTDPGSVDTHSALINWGDGNSQTVNYATSPFSLQHTYALAGPYTAGVTVTDKDGGFGTATASATVNFNTSGFLQPINADGTSVFKFNSTIPVKIRFTDCNGAVPANLAPTIKLTLMSGSTPVLDINEPVSTSAADTTGVMRFSTNQYIYNLATKPLPDPSATYRITVTVPFTGQTATVVFGLRP